MHLGTVTSPITIDSDTDLLTVFGESFKLLAELEKTERDRAATDLPTCSTLAGHVREALDTEDSVRRELLARMGN